MAPFHTVHVDMVGLWSAKFSMLGKSVTREVQALTMVDKATNWPEIAAVDTKASRVMSEVFDTEWLC